MGGKNSKTELNRSKSFSTFGRSSQRSLFQKSKLALNQINKKLKNDSINHDEIKAQLEKVEKDLCEISPTVKEKNHQKHEDVLKYFQETKKQFEEKAQRIEQTLQAEQTPPEAEDSKPENTENPQTVELKLIKVFHSSENLNVEARNDVSKDEEDVELRKPSDTKKGLDIIEEVATSPKVKFGVQVMPIDPRVSQQLLKRNTLPVNEAPKEEFKKIRNISDSGVSEWKEKHEKFQANISYPSSPSADKKMELGTLEKRELDATALKTIESITKDVDDLENNLKYFKGKKWDTNYMELHKLLINNLIQLDNVQVHGDSVVKQERKIVVKRIQELIKILECLGEQEENSSNEENEEVDSNEGLNNKSEKIVKKQEEIINLEGKPVTATAI
ncbi:hypothetical protein ILUMI_00117 [Ignelater luminosus]|uniref:BAG domain-containing protein n=1 Tax=Ignelater luminosus TaxID=2038154 RepID=A0A8K0DHW7_IGNLU|nr:hypothetical protein ILUMI_00117 [Ignelater luminosus]